MRNRNEQTRSPAAKRGLHSRTRSSLLRLWLAGSMFAGLTAVAQNPKTVSPLPIIDAGVVLPPSQPLPSARKDVAALAIIREYQRAVGHAKWSDLEATGEVTPAGITSGATSTAQSATLWIAGHTKYRLDVHTPRGTISIRIDGVHGSMQMPGGRNLPIDPPDAVAGLVAFPQTNASDFPTDSTALIDQGLVQVDGIAVHRITAEIPWSAETATGTPTTITEITDLYFDPTTKLLLKSVNTLQGTSPNSTRYTKVITYAEYRDVGGVRIPSQYRESINGRELWTMHLTQMEFTSHSDGTAFHF